MYAGANLPWMKLHDFLVEVGAERTVQDFKSIILQRIDNLIPYDVAAVWFEMGQTRPLYLCDHLGIPPKWVAAHNDYYYKVAPEVDDLKVRKITFSNYQRFQNSEYFQDFMHPQGIHYGAGLILHDLSGNPSVSLCITDSGYNYEQDRQVQELLELIQPHLANYYSYLNLISTQTRDEICPVELEERFKILLSKREVEIAGLLCQRLTSAEISSRLLISPRTVEFHIFNIYQKLKVRNRRELMVKLAAWK